MPKQRVLPGSRWRVEDMNVASDQAAQFYTNEAARDAAFQGEEPNQQTIVHLSDPPTEDLRWQRWNGTMWIPAGLAGEITCGWRNDIVITDRTNTATHKAVVVLSRAPAAGEMFTVQWRTVDGTATVAENDYTAVPWTTLTFAAGETSKEVEFSVTGKGATVYPKEEFHLELGSPSEGSTTFRIGGRADVILPDSVSAGQPLPGLTLTLTDPPATPEGDKATIRATINREAGGPVSFNYSTRATSRGGGEDAPSTLYAATASATATIPDGALFVDFTIQTNDVAATTTSATQYFEVVVPQSSIISGGGDTIATTGHDLVALVAVTRNQVVLPNVYVGWPFLSVSDATTTTHTVANVPQRILLSNADGSGREGGIIPSRLTLRSTPAGWPGMRLPILSDKPPVNAQVFWKVTFPSVYEDIAGQTPTYRQVIVEGRLDIPATHSVHDELSPNVSFMPQPSPGADAWYSKASYTNLRILTTGTLCVVEYTNTTGIRKRPQASVTYRA